MAAIATSLIPARDLTPLSIPGCSSSALLAQSIANCGPTKLSVGPILHSNGKLTTTKRQVTVRAGLSENVGRPSSAGIFIGGFILGGMIVGALGAVYAPQISNALSAAPDKKDLMRKLPKFIYDEEKELEKTRKKLEEKIAQLNSDIDAFSHDLRGHDHDDAEGSYPAVDDAERAY